MKKHDLDFIRDLALLGISAILGIILAICVISSKEITFEQRQQQIQKELNMQRMSVVKDQIINEIDMYLYNVAPTCKVNASILFDLCDQYEVDVRFALAQGQVESHFATKGTAKKTNSIFNVGAYDGHSAKRQIRNGFGYKDPNDSIEPYLILITNYYLVDGKTINDLMKNYVNLYGMRYASSVKYEKMLRTVYNRINKNTELDILIIEYNELKMMV